MNQETSAMCKREWAPTEPATYDCLVALREPVSRTISHYYHFLQKARPEYQGRRLSDLSTAELRDVIGSCGGNVMVDYLSTGIDQQAAPWDKAEKLDTAKDNLSKCVVAILEDWQVSSRMIEKQHPWLNGAVATAPVKNAASSRHESLEDLSKEQINIFRELLSWDIQLYSDGLVLYEQQLKRQSFVAATNLAVSYDNEAIETSESEQATPFVKAVSYFGRNNPLTFWNSDRFDSHIREDFAQFVVEGFNTIILLVPWAGFQVSVVPPEYDAQYQSRLEYVLNVAAEFNLFVITRVSYPHDFHPENSPPGGQRCELTMVEEKYAPGFREGWIDYLTVLNGIVTKPQFKNVFLYSFFSWEDFFCLISFTRAPEEARRRLAEQLGFGTYVRTKYSANETLDMFQMDPSEIIVPLEGHGRLFEVYIEFIESKWWGLMETGRRVHPRLTMEVRVDIEPVVYPDGSRGGKGYDIHLDDIGPPRQLYWSKNMGNQRGSILTAADTAKGLNHIMSRSTNSGRAPAILGQFNFIDNTPGTEGAAQMPPTECPEFLRQAAPILKKNTVGYGLWAYRNYRQSEVFNGSFLRGLQGWKMGIVGDGKAAVGEDGYLLLSGGVSTGSSASVEQMARQLPEEACDEKDNRMSLCFLARAQTASSQLEILWNNTRAYAVNVSESSWQPHCFRLPALGNYKRFPFTFQTLAASAVQIDRVEFFCHTHNMYIRDVQNELIPECGPSIPILNQLLDESSSPLR